MNVTVSVIIPTHNRAKLLRCAIESVLQQTYPYLECIVVDDASTDNTSEIVKQYDDSRLVYLRHEVNRYASAARNTGIAYAKGEFIAFLDDDDQWLSTKLEKQVPILLNAATSVGMVYCWMDYYEESRLIAEHHPTYRGNVFPFVFDKQRIGGCPTLLIRRDVIKHIGQFDENLPRGNDGDFIRRICYSYEVDVVEEVLVHVHVAHGYQRITSNHRDGIINAIKGEKVKLTKFKSELRRYPRQTATILTKIAYHYSQLSDWQQATWFYIRALGYSPLQINIYKNMVHSLYHLFTGFTRPRKNGESSG